MLTIVIVVIVISTILFSLLFLYFHRIYKQLRIRHQKPVPLPDAIPPALEQHQELAFVLAHGVEAYNELRRQRLQRERGSVRRTNSATIGSQNNNDDSASIQSSHPSITAAAAIEPPPVYSADPVDGDIGYGWRAVGHASIFGHPAMTGISPSTLTATTTHPLDNSLPPVYIYQPPSSRSAAQAALLTTDNSPTVSVPMSSGSVQVVVGSGPRSGRRRSVASGPSTRGQQRSISLSTVSVSSSSSSSIPETIQPCGPSTPNITSVQQQENPSGSHPAHTTSILEESTAHDTRRTQRSSNEN